MAINLNNISKKLLESVKKIEPGLAEMICYQLFDYKENTISEKNINAYHPEISLGLKLTTISPENTNFIEIETGLSSLYLFKSGLSIHEEIGAGTPNINNKDTLWWKWGPAQAINAGDCLYSLSRLMILEENNLNDQAKINLLQRTYEYAIDYFPFASASTGTPRYYSRKTNTQIYIVPTPASAVSGEIQYTRRPLALASATGTSVTTSNYFSEFCYNALFSACMVEANYFIKDLSGLRAK